MAEHDYTARGVPHLWALWVLIPVTALMTWMAFEAPTARFETFARDQGGAAGALGAAPISLRTIFFGACALICLAAIAAQVYRRVARRIEASADSEGVTSHLFWGPGTLRWDAIEAITMRGLWLYIHGTDARGRRRRLIFDLSGLEGGPDGLLAAIHKRRPDLVSATW